jgi:hypothetical protein
MAQITIKDLPQSDELDRRAKLSIVGGARAGVRPFIDPKRAALRGGRIVDYPPGFGRAGQLAGASGRRSGA